jgi:UDP-glucose 4-epimerase
VKWLVTGGCGFIGVNLVRRLAAEGSHSIRIIDNLSVGTRDDLAAVTPFREWTPVSVSADAQFFASNPDLPQVVVGDILDEKLAGEGYCSAYYRTFGIETVALRFGNVYGPFSGHKNSVVAKFIRRALAGEPLEIYGDGSQTRDFIYVDDLVDAIERADLSEGVGGEVLQIATHTETSVAELLELLLSVLSDTGYSGVRFLNSAPRLGDVKRNYSDISKAQRMLGWRPAVDLRRGLRQTAGWFLGEWFPEG